MQFTKENAEKVMAGTKTQTRRVIKKGERRVWISDLTVLAADRNGNEQIKWQVGRIYAVCPGRGKSAIGRVKLLNIRPAELQSISEADCAAELGCLAKWPGPGPEPYKRNLRAAFADLWDSINPKGKRWADNPDVWALTFEVVQ